MYRVGQGKAWTTSTVMGGTTQMSPSHDRALELRFASHNDHLSTTGTVERDPSNILNLSHFEALGGKGNEFNSNALA
jgi:hypothetical protein